MNANNTILVTGASGQQGGAVAKSLLKQGESVRAVSRSIEKLKELGEQGAQVITGDLSDPNSLNTVLKGIKRAYLVTTPFEAGMEMEVKQGINFIDEAKKADVEHIVFSSVASANDHTQIPHFETKSKVESYLKDSGIAYTIIRPVFFMENFGSPWFLPSIQQGKLALPVRPDLVMQMVSLDVIGNFGAAAFLRPKEFLGKEIDLASDQLTFPEAMKLLSEVSRKSIVYEEFPEDQSEKTFGIDFAKMFSWFNKVGFSSDIPSLKKWGIPLTTYKQHLASAAWVKQIT